MLWFRFMLEELDGIDFLESGVVASVLGERDRFLFCPFPFLFPGRGGSSGVFKKSDTLSVYLGK
jgi:hypothetical protein